MSFSELFSVFGRIGLLSFGGPAGQIALMHRMLVEERRWLADARFMHALNFCMLLPGPEAMQLATYSGWLLKGVRGGLIAGLLFILPGFAVLLGLSTIYIMFGAVPLVAGLLAGLQAAVLAIVAEALIKVAKRALTSSGAAAIAVSAFIAIAFLGVAFPLIVLFAAIAGVGLHRLGLTRVSVDDGEGAEKAGSVSIISTLATIAAWLAIWLGPLAVLYVALGSDNVFAALAAFFSKTAIVTFGGAYAVLAYVGQQAVEIYGWLQPDEMLTGLGLAETTPGPLILVLVFVGYVGASRLSGFDPVTGGLAGGLTALFFTFAPCFLWIFAGAPFVERLRGIAWLSAALAGITAAVVGVIANLALWFGLHTLFGDVGEVALGPLRFPTVDLVTLDLSAALIALAAGFMLIGLRWPVVGVLALAGIAGAAIALSA